MPNSEPPLRDLTASPDLSRVRQTGPKRSHVPTYKDLMPPCNHACPAGENIQAWLAECQQQNDEAAWRILTRDNPMAAIHGRICYHPCESHCNRSELDQTVSIHAVERFLGDLAIARGWMFEPPATETGRRVLVVGAGPSGLSAAYHLRRRGHSVDVYEAGPVAGGMMRFGIPAYRLPRDVLDAEIHRIEALGVAFHFGTKVVDLEQTQRDGNFDAVFVAIGAHLSKRMGVPACDAGHVTDALTFLRESETQEKPLLGRRVAVYGGGNTAMDAARTAQRLGAAETVIIYRRTRDRAPAHEEEITGALEEGIKINWLQTIAGIDDASLHIEKMELNAEGYPEPTGHFTTLDADDLILALGQEADSDFMRKVPDLNIADDGTVVVDQRMMTTHAGWFMGGDMVPCERTVTVATGHGKKAAANIDAWLRETFTQPVDKPEIATRDHLNVWYYSDAKTRKQERLDAASRTAGFGEVVAGLSAAEALFEARRCLSCGNCFECDGCYGACPEDAIIKLGPGKRYRFDYERCTGCATCFEQCPSGAITMLAEGKI